MLATAQARTVVSFGPVGGGPTGEHGSFHLTGRAWPQAGVPEVEHVLADVLVDQADEGGDASVLVPGCEDLQPDLVIHRTHSMAQVGRKAQTSNSAIWPKGTERRRSPSSTA